jgi:hypothetical protein
LAGSVFAAKALLVFGVPMRIDAHPLVVAAALGLLGPAALAADEPMSGLGGEWARDGAAAATVASLGESFEVIPVEEHFMIGGDDGVDQGSWTRLSDERAVQVVSLGGLEVRRSFAAEGDTLVVRTDVQSDANGCASSYVERFNRLG